LAWLVQKDRYVFAFSNSARPFPRQKGVSITVMATKAFTGGGLSFWMDEGMRIYAGPAQT
jgi:hypothetical protein